MKMSDTFKHLPIAVSPIRLACCDQNELDAIKHAVDNHDDLVEALESLLFSVKYKGDEARCIFCNEETHSHTEQCVYNNAKNTLFEAQREPRPGSKGS